MRFFVCASCGDPVPDNYVRRLRDRGVATRLGYPVYGGEAAAPPLAALSLRPRLIELPSHSRMTVAEIDAVLEALPEAIRYCDKRS